MAALAVNSFAYSWSDYYYSNYYNYRPSYSYSSSYSTPSYTYDIYTYKVSSGNATITDCKSTAGGTIKIPSKIEDYDVTAINSSAFEDCSRITSITIPSSVTSIGNGAFEDCSSLKSITIPKGITRIEGNTFKGCSSLTGITIPSGVTSIGYGAFEGCSSLTAITLPTAVKTIEDSTFKDCTKLSSINIHKGITTIGNNAFENCSSLSKITIPDSVTSIKTNAFLNTGYYKNASNWDNNSVLYIGDFLIRANSDISGSYKIKEGTKKMADSAFMDCTALEEITIPESITKIRYQAFKGCTSLSKVTIPNTVTSIGIDTFYNCTSLTDVTIPDSVTAIAKNAFYNVPNVAYSENMKAENAPWGAKAENAKVKGPLVFENSKKKTIIVCASSATKVSIPRSVKEIKEGAFTNCKSLKKIYYGGTNGRNIKSISLYDALVLSNAKCYTIPFHIFCAIMFICCIAAIILLNKKKNIPLYKFIGIFMILLSLIILGLRNSGHFNKFFVWEIFALKVFPSSLFMYLGIILTALILIYPITAKGTRVCWKHVFVLSTLFGYDRFIRGQYGRGIIKMLTGGGFLIWAYIDFFVAATKAYGSELRGIDYFTFVDGKYSKEPQVSTDSTPKAIPEPTPAPTEVAESKDEDTSNQE